MENKENNENRSRTYTKKRFKESDDSSDRRGFRRRPGFSGRSIQRDTVSNLSDAKANTYFRGTVKIVRKAKPGPTVFSVSDGYLQVDAVTPESEFSVDDIVELKGKVNERAGKIQIEIDSMNKIKMDFDSILDEKSMPSNRALSIKSERLETMRPRMMEIAQRLRRAVLDGEAIMIRHHADTDGISAGIALQHSLEALMAKVGVNKAYYLYRSPSKAPFYETSDVLHDFTRAKRMEKEFGQKKPLFLVVDNGSTPEDAFAHKTLHDLGYDVIVIDHHNPVEMQGNETSVCKYLTLHLNPYMFGFDGNTCAGMLAYEIARLIDEDYEEKLIPAVTGISDRCEIPETQEYIKNTGRSREELTNIGIAIDFASYNMRFASGEGLYEEILVNPEMVEMMTEKVRAGMETQLQSTLPYVKTQEINDVIFSHIDLEKYTMRFQYPPPGKVIGMIHDTIAEGKDHHAVLSIGYLSDMIIVRATKPVLPVATMIANLQKELPEANVDGGGHECAGAIKFVSAHQSGVIESIKRQLKELPQDTISEEE